MTENDPPTVTERSWYGASMGTPNTMTRDQFGRDMAEIREWGEQVNVWSGQDRHGAPLKVVWVSRPRMGHATLYAYEIPGGDAPSPSKAPGAFGTEWTVRSRYETTDGDRVALLRLDGTGGERTAVSYTYAWPHAPQFIEYTDPLDAFKAFSISYQNAYRRGDVVHAEG